MFHLGVTSSPFVASEIPWCGFSKALEMPVLSTEIGRRLRAIFDAKLARSKIGFRCIGAGEAEEIILLRMPRVNPKKNPKDWCFVWKISGKTIDFWEKTFCKILKSLRIQSMDYLHAFGYARSQSVRPCYLRSDHDFCMHFRNIFSD